MDTSEVVGGVVDGRPLSGTPREVTGPRPARPAEGVSLVLLSSVLPRDVEGGSGLTHSWGSGVSRTQTDSLRSTRPLPFQSSRPLLRHP